jgi:hypothetical protein
MTALASTGRVELLTFAALVPVTAFVGCTLENFTSQNASSENDTGDPVVVAAGDIASCFGTGDEATSRLLSNIEGTVLTLGDNAGHVTEEHRSAKLLGVLYNTNKNTHTHGYARTLA